MKNIIFLIIELNFEMHFSDLKVQRALGSLGYLAERAMK